MSTSALNADGSKFAVVDDNRVKIYATSSGALLLQCVEPRHVAAYVCLCWAPKVVVVFFFTSGDRWWCERFVGCVDRPMHVMDSHCCDRDRGSWWRWERKTALW